MPGPRPSYYEDIYIQGGNFLDDTRKAMGPAAFWAGIRDYLATYRYRIGGTKLLLDTLDAHTPLNLVTRYGPRFPSLYRGPGAGCSGCAQPTSASSHDRGPRSVGPV